MAGEDLHRLVSNLFDWGCTLLPDINFSEPEALLLHNMDDYASFNDRCQTTLMFAFSPDWEPDPFEFGSFDKDGRTHYYIRQKTGGPTLDVFSPRAYTLKGKVVLPHGFIGYHARYWSTISGVEKRSPDALKRLYEKTVRLMRAGSDLVKTSKRRYVITRDAKRMLEEGAVLGPPFTTASSTD